MKYLFFIALLSSSTLWGQIEERKFSIYFENDVYNLSDVHHRLLDSIKRFENKEALDVHIKGFTNSIGSEGYNLGLSRRRANAVKSRLREFTIVSSDGYGEIDSPAAENRRVDILVHLKIDHIPEEGEIIEPPQIPSTPQPTIAGLKKPKIGDRVILEGIRFYPDRDVIMDESIEALEELVSFLKKNPDVKFKLIGHICCGDPMQPAKDLKNVRTGKDNLSEARAQALHNYLAKKGISTRRMRYIGMAFRQSTGKGAQFDRRVEIEITSVR